MNGHGPKVNISSHWWFTITLVYLHFRRPLLLRNLCESRASNESSSHSRFTCHEIVLPLTRALEVHDRTARIRTSSWWITTAERQAPPAANIPRHLAHHTIVITTYRPYLRQDATRQAPTLLRTNNYLSNACRPPRLHQAETAYQCSHRVRREELRLLPRTGWDKGWWCRVGLLLNSSIKCRLCRFIQTLRWPSRPLHIRLERPSRHPATLHQCPNTHKNTARVPAQGSTRELQLDQLGRPAPLPSRKDLHTLRSLGR